MFVPVFTLNLNQKLLPGRVAIGDFDGEHACLAAATTGERVLIHNPHQRLSSSVAASGRMEAGHANQEISMLHIQQRVTALATGKLDPASSASQLLVGTPTNLLAYDVERNADLFHKDVPDGVNAVVVGKLTPDSNNLAIVGGNCSLQGFDHKGNDPFWTVTGDNVSSLALVDYSNNGLQRLVVGSEDFEVRIFAEDEILAEITETEAVTALAPVEEGRFGYALANGTVGVYEKTTRWWRIKSKNNATAICGFDLDGDGVKELITGWSNGKLDARNDRSGEVVFKDNFNHAVAGLAQGDYRNDGHLELVACATEGEVRGYLPSNQDTARPKTFDLTSEQETVRELTHRRQNLLLELRNYEENARMSNTNAGAILAASRGGTLLSNNNGGMNQQVGVIPAQTQLSTSLALNLGSDGKAPHVEVSLSTSNDTVIRCVLIFAEGIFEGECHVVHPRETLSTIQVPIFPPRNIPVDLHIKAFVGYKNSKNFHVFELTRQLPRFAMYCRLNSPVLNPGDSSPPPMDDSGKLPPPKGHLTLKVNERAARVAMWLNQNFLLGDEEIAASAEGQLEAVVFVSLRNRSQEMHFNMASDGTIHIQCDNMDFCGDIVQALVEYLGVDDLTSTCDFPDDLEELEAMLSSADELQSVRQRLSAEMADHSGIIRSLIVRAEDSRLMLDMKNMRKWYSQLYDINRDLIAGYKIRCNNHNQLMDTLKNVNQVIQKAGRLRAGKSKAKVITECRNAIKTNNVNLLLKVIRTGSDSS